MSDTSRPLLSRAFLVCFAANLLQGLAFNLFLHLPGYLHDLGAGDTQIGFLTGLTAFAAIVLRGPLGPLMDRHGRRGITWAGGLLMVGSLSLYLIVEAIDVTLILVRILHGLAEAILFTALFTYAADVVPEQSRTQGLALFGVSGMLPISLGGVLGDALLARGGFPLLFEAAVGISLFALVVSLALPRLERLRPAEGERVGMRAALGQRDLLPLWWITSVFFLVLAAFWIFIKRFVDETGVGSVGLFFSAYTVAALFVRIAAGRLPDRVGPKRVLAPSLACLAVGFAVMLGATSAAALAVAGLLCGVGHGYAFPILFGMVVTRTPAANRGAAMAIYTGLSDLGMLLGGPLFGALVDLLGFGPMFAFAGVVTLAGSVVFFVWDARVAGPRPAG
ncbi:MAG: MFS transporter [Myxococcota bacterium]